MGKSSSQVVGYRYCAKFTAFIGNRIEKLIAINFDNRKWIIHDPLKHPPNLLPVLENNLFGENEGGVSGNIDIHFGTPDQEPNEVYQQYLPLVSGYPYQSYLLFRGITFVNQFTGAQTTAPGFYLGNSGYMKEMLLWVKRTRVRNDGRGQWYEVREDGAIVCEIGAVKSTNTGDDQEFIPAFDYEIRKIGKFTSTSIGYDGNYAGAYDGKNNLVLSESANGWNYNSENSSGTVDISWKINFQGATGFMRCVVVHSAIGVTEDIGVFAGGGLVSMTILNEEETQDSKLTTIEYVIDLSKTTSIEFYSKAVGSIIHNGAFRYGASIPSIQLFKPTSNQEAGDLEGIDINPIHKIREILTDDTAMGKPESEINDRNFMEAADRIYDESLGISWAIDEKSCIEAIEELCYHIEAGIRVNRQTGLYEIVLFRDNWFEDDEVHEITESKIKDLSLEVMNSDDIVNQLNVTYYDRERIKNSTFSVYENGSILTMGHANAESVEFPYFMNMRNAEIVANWKLRQFSTPAWSGSFTTGWREARKWNRYDLIRLPWSSKWNGTILVRIMKINLGNGTNNTVTIDFEEVIPYSGEMSTSIVVDESMNDGVQPPQPSVNAVFEAPYYLTVLRAGQTNADLELSNNPDIGYVAAIAAKPQSNSLNALLYTDGGVGEFEQVSRLDYCDLLQLDQLITEITSSFVVTGSLTQAANSNNLILLNDELMGFVSFDDETKVLTVKRGVLDTVPKKHSSGSLFVFDLPDVALDSTQYSQSEIIEAQVLTTTPSGIQSLSETGVPVEIKSRAIRPYPPANVKINGEYFPAKIETDLIVTWADRNRLQQTSGEILGWTDGSVTLEPGVTYHYEVKNDSNIILASGDDVRSGLILETADFYPQAMLKLWSRRDSYDSYQSVEILLVSALGELINFIEPIYANGEKVNLIAKLSNGAEIGSLSLISGSLPTGWSISGTSIVGHATADGSYTFELEVTDMNNNSIQKEFSVTVQGQVWSQLTFDSQNMTDEVAGNTWSQGAGNVFVGGYESDYALKMGGTAPSSISKSLALSGNTVSMSAWVKLDSYGQYEGVFYAGSLSSNNQRDTLYIHPDGDLRVYRQAGAGTGATLETGQFIPLNTWTHIAYERNGINQRVFVNHELIATDINTASVVTASNVHIGGNRSGGVAIYSKLAIDNALITIGANRFS